MIPAKSYQQSTIQQAYDRRSWLYSKTVARVEYRYHLEALEMASLRKGERVLEVAVGPGLTMLEIARRVGPEVPINGVDLSPGMLAMTQRRLTAHGFTNVKLQQANARQLPFDIGQFDVVYNAYMLDLIPEQDMQGILAEFFRVLRPGGRLILLNMSKQEDSSSRRDWRERLYQALPATLTLYVLGGCRPVLMQSAVATAGFIGVTRHFMDGPAPSELIVAHKPAS